MTVRIRIEKRGLYGQNGPIAIGTELTLPEEPKGWAGRYTVLSDSKGKTAVTNPDYRPLDDHTVAELRQIAEAEGVELGDSTKKADIVAAIELAREEKAKD